MKKHRLGPQNGPRSLGTEKLLKIVSCQKNVLSQLEKVGGHLLHNRKLCLMCMDKFSLIFLFLLL
jgi:hypothetical protein